MLEQAAQREDEPVAQGIGIVGRCAGEGAGVTTALACLGGLLGLVVGSFLNVVAYRVPLGRSVIRPRSACPACGHEVRAGDNVPVLSWLLLRGRCRDCGTAISVRYPLVETATAAAFAGLALLVGAAWVLPGYWWAAGAAIALTLTDLDCRRIPDRILVPGIVGAGVLLGLGSILEGDLWAVGRSLAGGAAYFGLLLLVALAARGGFGFGDVKLGFLLGLVLAHRSWAALLVGAFAAFALGGLVAVGLLAARRVRRKDAIPFGPVMVAGAALALVVGDTIARWYLG
jgi:leader peptidase (prepilin peptidase)/N-methyltransferase